MTKAKLFRYGIRRFKADSPDIISQAVWVLLYDLNTVVSVGLKDLCCMSSTYIMSLQKEHDILDFLLLLPALSDLLDTFPADPCNLNQPFRGEFF